MFRIVYIITILTLFIFIPARGQERTDFFFYDSLTYKEYNDARWDDLARDSRRAISLGHDFYYMRMRLGISMYERGKYLPAIHQFRQALEFNEGDPVATEYLYYCYLFAGKELTANAISAGFSKSLRSRTGVDENPVSRVSVDYVYNKAITDELINDYTAVDGYGDTGNLTIPKNYSNFGLSFTSRASDYTSVNYAITYLRKSNLLSFNDGVYYYDNFEQNLNQLQLYLSLSFSNDKGLTVTPALHYLNTGYPLLYVSSSGMSARIFSYRVMEHNIATSLKINRNAGIVDIGIEGVWSRLNYSDHLQAMGSFFLRPAGNNNLYFGGTVAVKTDRTGTGWSPSMVYNPLLGFGIAGRVWFDFSALLGDIANYTDRSGYLVYNGINRIDYIYKADMSIPFGKSGVVFYAGARYSSEYTSFVPEGETLSTVTGTNYKSISILGGLSWKF